MKLFLSEKWRNKLAPLIDTDWFKNLMDFVEYEYSTHTCYPPQELIFAAFNQCEYSDLKVVIIGQDPYHGFNQANGLAFSVADYVKTPPSLVNIFREIEQDTDSAFPLTGNLERWAKQGVLLLNATLTVREGQAGSHQKKGWEKFTNTAIEVISQENEGIVFLLWGSYAQQKQKLIDQEKHLILTCGHPSPLSANRGLWFGNKHFSQTNNYLKKIGKSTIEW